MYCRMLPMLALTILPSVTLAATIDTVAGTGQRGDNGGSGLSLQSNVGEPFGVEVGPDGALYITEVANHRIRRLDLENNELITVAPRPPRSLPSHTEFVSVWMDQSTLVIL